MDLFEFLIFGEIIINKDIKLFLKRNYLVIC